MSAEERARILREYERRAREVPDSRYAPWLPHEIVSREERRTIVLSQLGALGRFPTPDDSCLEVGPGKLGWLGDLVSWGVSASKLAGIDLDPARLGEAEARLPGADLRVGDATRLPWPDHSFRLVVCSTIFSSVLDPAMQVGIAGEVRRVLRPDGAVVWYDLALDNPWNPAVKGMKRAAIQRLFPDLRLRLKSATLSPPIARRVARAGLTPVTLLSKIPPLRTHLAGLLTPDAR